MTGATRTSILAHGWLAAAGLLYVALALPLVLRQGTHWDEQTDLEIATSLSLSRSGSLAGSGIDSINTRLPMFVVSLLEPAGVPISTRSARCVSIAVSLVLLAGTYLVGRRLLDTPKAILAVVALAVSPYFLAYSPLALTEGDTYIAAAVVWVALFALRLADDPSWLGCAGLGLALGIAVSAKISGVALVPAVVLVTTGPLAIAAWRNGDRPSPRAAAVWLAIVGAFGAWLCLQVVGTGAGLMSLGERLPPSVLRPSTRLAFVLAAWLGTLGWCWRARARRASALGLLVLPPLLGAITFFVVPPAHTLNPAIFSGIVRETLRSGGGIDLAFAAEAALFHVLVVLLKPSVGIGLAFLCGLAWAVWRMSRRPAFRLPIALIVFYGSFLLTLPWAQVRYVLPLVPFLALLAADAALDLWRARPRVAAWLGVATLALLAWDFRACYPDLNLNGYQWLGTGYFAGRPTLGYRAIGQVGEDGVEQALRWAVEHVDPQATLATFVPARHVVREFARPARFRVVDGVAIRGALAEADYVVTCLNGDVILADDPDATGDNPFVYPYYDRAALEHDFERVFRVRRAFDIEVAAVWRRR